MSAIQHLAATTGITALLRLHWRSFLSIIFIDVLTTLTYYSHCKQFYTHARTHTHTGLTWGDAPANTVVHREAQGALQPAGQGVQQQSGDRVEALAAGETVTWGTAHGRLSLGLQHRLPETQYPQTPAV